MYWSVCSLCSRYPEGFLVNNLSLRHKQIFTLRSLDQTIYLENLERDLWRKHLMYVQEDLKFKIYWSNNK